MQETKIEWCNFSILKNKRSLGIVFLLSALPFIIGTLHHFGGDEVKYTGLVEWIRGNGALSNVEETVRNRILVPLLSFLLPFSAKTSIQVINFVFLFAASLVLFEFMNSLGMGEYSLLGVGLFTFSVPYMLYGSAALTDAAMMFFIILTLYLIWKDSLYTPFVISVGLMAREPVLFMLPVYYFWLFKNNAKSICYVLGLLPIAVLLSVRVIISGFGGSSSIGSFWVPALDNVLYNLHYMKTYSALSLWLTSIPIIIVLVYLYINKNKLAWDKKEIQFLTKSGALMLLMPLFAFLAAILDGREVWFLYPVIIPLCAVAIDLHKKP